MSIVGNLDDLARFDSDDELINPENYYTDTTTDNYKLVGYFVKQPYSAPTINMLSRDLSMTRSEIINIVHNRDYFQFVHFKNESKRLIFSNHKCKKSCDYDYRLEETIIIS